MKKQDINNRIWRRNHIRLVCIFFIITLCAFGHGNLYAQWGFTATLSYSGNCQGAGNIYKPSIPAITGFSTKAECEAARAQVLNIKGSAGGCTVYYKCSACTGSDIGGTQTGGFTSTTISGPDQGAPNFTPNQARTVQDWMDDYMQKIQSMGFDNASMIALSGNKDFDRVYNDRQKGYIPRAVYFNGRAVSPDRFSYDRKGGRAGALGGFNINPDRPSSKGVGGQMRQSASQMLREAQQQRFGTLTKYEHTNVSAKDKQSNGTVLKNISKEDLKNAENSDEGQRLNALLEGFREGVRIESPKKVWQENKVVLDAIEAIEKNGFLDEETYNKLTEDQRKEVGEAVEHAKTMTKEEQEALKEKNKERKEVENKLEDLKKRHKEKNPNDENCLECAPYEEKAVELQEDEKVLRGIKRKSGTKKNNSKNKNKK